MIHPMSKRDCCGCEACVQICPKHCITFVEDSEGFMYPSVEESRCIDCHLCEKVCPVLNPFEPVEPVETYAAKAKSQDDLIASSSGGLFITVAKSILQEGGVVFGAAFDEGFMTVSHCYTEQSDELRKLIGSKYLQSRIGNSFAKIKTFLDTGRKVLFCGTGCHVLALKRFLQRDYENLLTIDLICHGVPSPKVWQRYLKEIESLQIPNKAHIKHISFRDKRISWENYSFSITYSKELKNGYSDTGLLSHEFIKNPYIWLYLNDLTLRPSCFACPAKCGKSHSDFTIGDYWGIELTYPELYDNKGVGLLIVNTDKGKQYIESLAIEKQLTSIDEATTENPLYYHSKSEPKKRQLFFQMFNNDNKSINELAALFKKETISEKGKKLMKRVIRAIKKRIL